MLQNIGKTLKVGSGRVLVRDYAEGDLAQARLAGPSKQQQLADHFYVRGDGTRAFYFPQVFFNATSGPQQADWVASAAFHADMTSEMSCHD